MVWASGGVAGALGDRAELVGQGVPNRSAPGDVCVEKLNILTSLMSADFGTCDISGGIARQRGR
eukprot:1923399-Prymnesium_polylepis.1